MNILKKSAKLVGAILVLRAGFDAVFVAGVFLLTMAGLT